MLLEDKLCQNLHKGASSISIMIGYILRQRYKIVDKLGSGGFGETYLAEYPQDLPVIPKYKCVIKRLIRPSTPDLDTEQRFKKEAAILFKLGKEHPQIPELYDFFEENREFYLVQEFIEGHDLSNEIISGKPWSEADVIQLLQEILEVLAFVHQHNVIHRDIKPLNLMRRYFDNKLVLIDFGAIKEISTPKVNIQGQISSTITIGTRDYMPSEQWEGHPQLCSDVYALGMTAIQALTGLTPQQLPKFETLELRWRDYAQINDGLANFLTKMVQRDFRQRYKNADEALQALQLALFNSQSSVTSVKMQALKLAQLRLESPIFSQKFQVSNLAQLGLQLAVASPKLVKIGDKYGYVDQTGKLVIQALFDMAREFSEGRAAVNIDRRESLFGGESVGKWGYIDEKGSWVIKPMFKMAYSFRNGQAKVEIGGQERIIDKRGMFID
ncbi:WG repeat-containing protein [Nostoc paludosum FACHB-159]|uniref:non-specific serine/threonine protein kinase n=2 Tax=Nostoc TaxID=1177 RepID=A0ABR8K3Z1_9NOSO|nr:WG repeat-containing protein [Nostoc paludosum]MBD2681798.1 WG repeat-containing protein [Nostoc sp. FACHB-857]MBD2733556.1 WG repeat-containing protein [Nostoc paludosum FACHB-159]